MHEFALTQNLLDLVLEKTGSKQVVRVNLLIGPFSEEREESIHFYWRDLAKGSPGEAAQLHFEQVPVEMRCLDCSGTFYLDENGNDSVCKYCQSDHLQLLHGEIRIESIEVK